MAKKVQDYLKVAAKAFASATINVQRFADAYVEAVNEVGEDAREAFRAAYPMFGAREWRRFWLVGSYILMPQFMFKSDSFVGKLLRYEKQNHVDLQRALVGASEDGALRVDRGHGPEKVSLAELTRKEQKILTLLISEQDEKLSPEELITKFCGLTRKVNKYTSTCPEPYEVCEKHGKKVVHFKRPCYLDVRELKMLVNELERK